MSTPAPTYEQAQAELNAFLAKGVPPSVVEKAQTAMADEVAKPETAKALIDEVKALGDSAIKIDQAFERVRIDLGKVDNNNYKDKDGKPIPKMQPTWVGFQKRYTKLLWDSRETATKTESYLNDFLEVIIPGVEDIQSGDDGALQDALLDLKEFINRKDPNGGVLNSDEASDLAEAHSQAFTDLRRDIAAFKESFDSFAKDQEASLNADIERLKGDISKLEAQIKQYQTIIAAMGIAFGVTVVGTAAGAVGALAACGPLGPAIAVGVIIVGAVAAVAELATLIAYLVKESDAKSTLAKKRRELEDLESQLSTLKSLQATLIAQKSDIDDICARIDRFAAIWAIVAHDADLISSDLQNAAGSATASSFKRRIKILKSSYTALRDGLREYATMVDQSGVPKPTA